MLPVPVPYKNSHATASRLASCIGNHNTSLHQWYTHNGHTTTRHLYRWDTQKSHARTCCLRQWYTQKQPRKNTLPPQVEDEKQSGKNMQQHPILTNGKWKTKHATTRYLHQWYTQNSHATNTLPSPVVHTKQSRHNMLPSPIVHTKTVIQQHVVYTNSYPTVRCFDQRSCNNSKLSSPVVSAKTVPKNRSPSPAEYNREF